MPEIAFQLQPRIIFVLQSSSMEKELLFLVFSISLASFSSAFHPSTAHFVLCGSGSNRTVDGRAFVADNESHSLHLSGGLTTSIEDPNPSSNSSSLLYRTARVFSSRSFYQFDIRTRGPHVVRLHFYPFSHQNHTLISAVFDVSARGFALLLKNFSIASRNHVLKEYLINIDGSKLDLSFTPLGKSGLAFINAMEVFSAPEHLFNGTARPMASAGAELFEYSTKDLETLYRVNVGGPQITPADDTLWRTWGQDDEFLLFKYGLDPVNYSQKIDFASVGLSRDVAPERIYNTARVTSDLNLVIQNSNITWNFPVATGFRYLVRMHFCDIVGKNTSQLHFNVYIRDLLATKDFHPSPPAAPLFMDFVVASYSSSRMLVSVGPSSDSSGKTIAILNGLEILRINNSRSRKRAKISVGIHIGIGFAALGVVILMTVAVWVVLKRMKRKEAGKPKIDGKLFSFKEIAIATNNFDESHIVGTGGFGNVYKGELRDGSKVAVKRCMSARSKQGRPEFEAETFFLSQIRHQNLVSLIGYCNEQSEMILIYEYMEQGPLKKHLYGSDLPCLSWVQRLKICIGAARGLHYLHTGFAQGIIHRDLKSVNILLDEDYSAKVADFGLSKLVPSADATHVTTNVKGTFGYIDPDYYRSSQLTLKSDVFSFGVVLLEVLCAQPVIDLSLRTRDTVSLIEWATEKQASMSLEEIIDPRIAGEVSKDALIMYWQTVEKCLEDYGEKRPSISIVLRNLERVLQLQEAAVSAPKHSTENAV